MLPLLLLPTLDANDDDGQENQDERSTHHPSCNGRGLAGRGQREKGGSLKQGSQLRLQLSGDANRLAGREAARQGLTKQRK